MSQQHDVQAQLSAFHALHFPGQPIPSLTSSEQHSNVQNPAVDIKEADEDDLGYYDDGVKRTLTPAQVKMFRHSEIQQLLAERRAAREKQESDENKKANHTRSSLDHDARKRQFHDEPSTETPQVDSLMYDDPPTVQASQDPPEKKFLWPILGR